MECYLFGIWFHPVLDAWLRAWQWWRHVRILVSLKRKEWGRLGRMLAQHRVVFAKTPGMVLWREESHLWRLKLNSWMFPVHAVLNYWKSSHKNVKKEFCNWRNKSYPRSSWKYFCISLGNIPQSFCVSLNMGPEMEEQEWWWPEECV